MLVSGSLVDEAAWWKQTVFFKIPCMAPPYQSSVDILQGNQQLLVGSEIHQPNNKLNKRNWDFLSLGIKDTLLNSYMTLYQPQQQTSQKKHGQNTLMDPKIRVAFYSLGASWYVLKGGFCMIHRSGHQPTGPVTSGLQASPRRFKSTPAKRGQGDKKTPTFFWGSKHTEPQQVALDV